MIARVMLTAAFVTIFGAPVAFALVIGVSLILYGA